MNTNEYKIDAARKTGRDSDLSLLQRMTPAESRRARAIAYKAALAVIG